MNMFDLKDVFKHIENTHIYIYTHRGPITYRDSIDRCYSRMRQNELHGKAKFPIKRPANATNTHFHTLVGIYGFPQHFLFQKLRHQSEKNNWSWFWASRVFFSCWERYFMPYFFILQMEEILCLRYQMSVSFSKHTGHPLFLVSFPPPLHFYTPF